MSSDEGLNELKSLVEGRGLLTALNTQQTATLLDVGVEALEKARESERRSSGGLAELRFHPRGRKAIYYLTDIIEYVQKTSSHGQLPWIFRTLSIMMGADFCRQVGVAYPHIPVPADGTGLGASFSPQPLLASLFGLSSDDTALSDLSVQAEQPRKRGPKSKKADNEAKLALERAGATVRRHICRFASLFDFLAHADINEEWLFCCPPDRRPYDAIVAIVTGPTDYDFKWMSLETYLNETKEWALQEQRLREAGEEGEEISRGIK